MKPGSGIILMKPSTHPAPGTHTPPATHLKPIFFQNAYQHRNLKFTMQTKFNKVKWSKKFGSNANAKFVLVTYVLVSSILDYQLSCKSGTHHIFRPKFFFQNNFWTPILSDPKFFWPRIFWTHNIFGYKIFWTQKFYDSEFVGPNIPFLPQSCRSQPGRRLSCFAPADTQQFTGPTVSETQQENKEKI